VPSEFSHLCPRSRYPARDVCVEKIKHYFESNSRETISKLFTGSGYWFVHWKTVTSGLKMLPSACSLKQYFQHLTYSFPRYRPPSWQRSYVNYGKDLHKRLAYFAKTKLKMRYHKGIMSWFSSFFLTRATCNIRQNRIACILTLLCSEEGLPFDTTRAV